MLKYVLSAKGLIWKHGSLYICRLSKSNQLYIVSCITNIINIVEDKNVDKVFVLIIGKILQNIIKRFATWINMSNEWTFER